MSDKTVDINDLAQKADVKVDSLAQLTALMRNAVAKKKDADTLAGIREDLATTVTALQEIASAAKATRESELDGQKFEAAEKASLRKLFDSASETEKLDIYNKAVAEFGQAGELHLSGSRKKTLIEGNVPKSHRDYELAQTLKKANDNLLFATALLGGIEGDNAPKIETMARASQMLSRVGELGVELFQKAPGDSLDTLTATDGLEFVPSLLSSNVIQDVWLNTAVAGTIKRIFMPSPTFTMPRITSVGRATHIQQKIDLNAANFYAGALGESPGLDSFDTGSVAFAAKKFGYMIMWADEFQEDSLPDALSLIRQDFVTGLGRSIEDAVINGNLTFGTTLDNAETVKLWTSAQDVRSMWNGIRRFWQLSAGAGGGIDGATFDVADLRGARKSLGKYGTNPSDLAYVFSPQSYIDVLNFPEVLTMDRIRDRATILNGQLGEIDGAPIIVSEFIYTNLASSGVFMPGQSRTMALLYRPESYLFGDRRMWRVESERSVFTGGNALLGSARMDFIKKRAHTSREEQIVRNIPA